MNMMYSQEDEIDSNSFNLSDCMTLEYFVWDIKSIGVSYLCQPCSETLVMVATYSTKANSGATPTDFRRVVKYVSGSGIIPSSLLSTCSRAPLQ
jgi:hypothetical protein